MCCDVCGIKSDVVVLEDVETTLCWECLEDFI